MRTENLWVYVALACLLPGSLSANSDKPDGYIQAYTECIENIADSMLAEQRRELTKFSATPVDFTSYEKMPRVCIMKELLPEKMQAALGGITKPGVLFDLGGSYSVYDAANMLGKRVLMQSGATLALDGCDISEEVVEEIRRRIKGESKRQESSVLGAPLVAARDGCQSREDFSPEVQKLITPAAGYSGIQILQGASSDACSQEAPGCKVFSKPEFERMFNTKIWHYSAERMFAITPCRLDKDFKEMLSRKKSEALQTGTFKPLIGALTGEWCAKPDPRPGYGSDVELRAVFGEEAGRTVGKAVITWPKTPGGPLGGPGYVSEIDLIPQRAEQRAGDNVIEFQEISRYRSGSTWSLVKSSAGWVLSDNDSTFRLKRACDGFWREDAAAGHKAGKDALLEELRGEWCSRATDNSSMQFRVAFNDDKGGFAGNATQVWGTPLGQPGSTIRSCMVPVRIDWNDANPAILFAVINGINSGALWWAHKSPTGWVVRDTQRDFNLSRKCDGFWREEATAPGQGSGLSSLFDFQISEAPLPVPPHTPFMVKVSLKKDFNGTAKFYSCDKARFMLLDPTNAEFVENRTYNVHAKTGFIAKFPAEFLGDAVGSIPFVCAELSEAPAGSEKKYYAELLNIQILRLDKPEDWYSSHIMEALALDEPFAQARTKKLLTNYYPPEEVYSLLPGLAEWIARDENVPQAERAFKMIIGKYGGREAARALGAALKSPIAEARKKALELLTFCGQDGKESSAAINELLLNETDEEVLRDALLLAGNWRLEMPPKFHKQGEISPEQDAVYKQEIKDVCDHAAAVDLSQKEEYPRYYDDTGARIPEPPEATKAIASLESLIKKMPDYPEMARAYLLLGRLKKRFEDDYAETYNPTTHESGIPPEITNKMEEYIDGGPSGSYYYNGYHFNRLITLFPNSEYADDAAFEKTNLSQGGECEGDENCSLDYGVSPYVEFLNKYPSSDLADKAIAAINGEFKWILNEKSERIAGTEYFSISGLEATIASYQKAVQDVAPQNKANAEDVICSLWLKTGKKEKALAACSDVLKNYPSYPQAAEVKARIGKIQGEGFELKPPEVAGHLLVELRWEPVKNSKGYSVYRSTEGTENFELLGSASAEPVYQDRTIAPATNYAYYIKADSGDGAVLLSNRVVAEVPGRRQGANFVFYNDDERALNILGYVSNAQHEGLPNLMRISDDGKVESQVAGSFYGYFKSALDKYADGVMLVDPVHGKYLSFPSEQAFENNIQIVRKQDQEINPYPQGKWWPRPGRNIISIRKDNKGVWLAGRDGDTWPQHDFLSWDAGNNICWEARGRVLVRYDSTASGHGTAVYPGESYYFMGIYPDERDGSIWAVGTQGNFYKVSRTGRVTNHLKMDPVTMINNVAFDMVNNYAWIINVNYNDPQKTKLKKISLSDGSVLAEVKPDEYTEPGEKHGNFSLFLSLDHKTGNLWVFNSDSGHVTILSPEGKTIKSVMVS